VAASAVHALGGNQGLHREERSKEEEGGREVECRVINNNVVR
jgi:hypothetical protein